ncbi:MAG: aldo/keto reductase [candidate division KSB1 bacterium]|nr:aldo/keto reductase [candidate division KSB1 bacterium]MDZ7385976.1 aldo/keto reductase [candidate division KSB1 bacterium]MDZ7392567.1 aldo/keto reductase [candidate division KSB1 bacterium]MDZ7413463.1 aldo/keto reductase [candidate division KSB1 bacterium]
MSKKLTRREFMGNIALGGLTLGAGWPLLRRLVPPQEAPPTVIYRALGKTGLRLPIVSFGVMNSDSPDLLRKALDLGIRHLDTANGYMGGKSEEVIGTIVAERKCRERVVIGTKLWFARDREGNFLSADRGPAPGATQENFDRMLSISLKRLQTDYVDILYLHSCQTAGMVTYEPLLKIYQEAKKKGVARFVGVSTHSNEPEVIRAAVDTGVWDVVLTAYNFMQGHREQVREAIKYAAQKGVGVIAMKTQAGARLNQRQAINHAAALKWVLNDQNVCTTIPGVTTFEQLALDWGLMANLKLSEEEERDLQLSSAHQAPYFCQGCRSCVASCPQHAEVPAAMRAYMYAFGYGNFLQAHQALAEWAELGGPAVCEECEKCVARCPHGIPVGRRVETMLAWSREELQLA